MTVLKDGRAVATKPTPDLTENLLVQMMIGYELKNVFQRKSRDWGAETLKVENLSLHGRFESVNFSVSEGEI